MTSPHGNGVLAASAVGTYAVIEVFSEGNQSRLWFYNAREGGP